MAASGAEFKMTPFGVTVKFPEGVDVTGGNPLMITTNTARLTPGLVGRSAPGSDPKDRPYSLNMMSIDGITKEVFISPSKQK